MIRLVALLCLLALPAKAEDIVLGLSRNEVSISTTFTGSDILVFGAVRRDDAAPLPGNLGVIVTIAGPDLPVTVRRKDRRLGIWVNVESVDIDVAPSFYAVATNAPLRDILDESEDINTRITIGKAIRSVGPSETGSAQFTDALIRIRAGEDLYQVLEGAVEVSEDTLFNTQVSLPANLTEGDYRAEIYLTRGGKIVDIHEAIIPVRKVGLEQWLYRIAHEQAFLYGLMSLAIAIAAGWGASAIFGLFRR